jgi:hypothetical protein
MSEMRLKHGASAATPSAGYSSLYAKTNSRLNVKDPDGNERELMTTDNAWRINLALNPGGETVLPGTHTTAITRINTASTTRNLHIPAWQWVSGTGSPDATITQDTAEITGASAASIKCAIAVLGTSNPVLRQLWNAAQYLEKHVYQCRGKVLNVAGDVKQSAATANACRMFITTNGTGGTTTYSEYHGATTDWERLLVDVTVPLDATEIQFGLVMASATPTFYLDNVQVEATSQAEATLPYQPRLSISINQITSYDALPTLDYSTPSDTNYHVSGDGTADTDLNINENRPAWAVRFLARVYAFSTSAVGSLFVIRPRGLAKPDSFAVVQSTLAANYIFPTAMLGADGQVEFAVDSMATDGGLQVVSWIGEGL